MESFKQFRISQENKQKLVRLRTEKFNETVEMLAENLRSGRITLNMWEEEMRTQLRLFHTGMAAIGKGGWSNCGPSEWGKVGNILREQYGYLHRFAQDIYDRRETITAKAIAWRAKLYGEKGGYTAAFVEAGDITEFLPWIPKDGSTECLCIVSGQSRVLTSKGWIPIALVCPGDLVLTHKGRWQKVLASIRKPSQPYHQLSRILAPTGKWVECTDNHLWYTPEGWLSSIDIDNSRVLLYHVHRSILEEVGHGAKLRKLRGKTRQQEQGNVVRAVQKEALRLSLWQQEGLSCDRVPELCFESKGYGAVAEYAPQDGSGASSFWKGTPGHVRGSELGYDMADPSRRSALDMVLGRRREAYNLSLPVGMDQGQWSDSRRVCGPSQGWGSYPRRVGESGIAQSFSTWSIAPRYDPQAAPRAYVRGVWEDFLQETTQGPSSQILFSGMLSLGTTLYDLTVENDESFIIEGLVAHNSNCRCEWLLSVGDSEDGIKPVTAVWTLSPAEHCPTCVERDGHTEQFYVAEETEVPRMIGGYG